MIMENGIDRSAPVVIGGVGGSGTRVVTNILTESGFYMGECREPTKDNRFFTSLFYGIPDGFTNLSKFEQTRMNKALGVFEEAMFSNFESNLKKASALMRGLWFITFNWNFLSTKNKLKRLLKGLIYIIYNSTLVPRLRYTDYSGWGWKEPVSHVYIEYLSNYFRNMKYILVIRQGLDMAFSANQGQFDIWAELFDISIPETPEMLPVAYLNYWIQANKRAIGLGEKLLGNRFMILSFEKLCYSPRKEVERLLSFLEIDDKKVDIDKLCDSVNAPDTINRYKSQNLSIFTDEDINAVREIEQMFEHE